MPDHTTNAKTLRADYQKENEKTHAEYKQRTMGNCTPTQEEIDLIKRGVPIFQKEDRVAPTQPETHEPTQPAARETISTRHMESGGAKGEYSTRVSRASSERAAERTPQSSTETKGE